MKQFKPFVICLGLLGFMNLPAYAEITDEQQIQTLEAQMSQLQHEMKALKTQIKAKKHQPAAKKKTEASTKSGETKVATAPTGAPGENTVINAPPYTLPLTGNRYLPIDLDTPGQSYVSTGPYLGVPVEYSGSSLIINNPSINEDVSLLKLRKNINSRLAEMGYKNPEDHGHLILSGIAEGQASMKKGGTGTSSDIDLSTAKLDAYVLGPSSWTSALLTFAYDNGVGVNSGVITTRNRVSNSRVFLDKGFITIGDFLKTPYYGSIGQMYVPFGVYSTNFITSPVTKTLARIKDRALLIGYQGQGSNAYYGSVYVFKGDSYIPSTSRKINNSGINAGYRFRCDKYNGDFGAGVVGNIADSIGMQITQNRPLFDGFGSSFNNCGPLGNGPCGNEQLVHRVPALDFHGLFTLWQRWNLIAEYVRTTTHFSVNDLSYNSHGAQPDAFSTELAYTFTAFDRPTSLVGGYGMTRETLAIGLPAKRYLVGLNTSIWRNTLQTLEIRHDIDYGKTVTSTGSGIPGPTGTGQSDNVITLQFDIYF